jgi:hypothetical protein
MKKLLILITTFVATTAYAVPAMNVFTINTSDPMGYMEWARKSAPITSPSSNTASAGVCLPSYGAEEFGDMYYFNLFESHADSISGNYYDPEVTAEIAKIANKRTVRMIDHYTPMGPVGEGFEVGMTYSNYNLNVYTKNPQAYMEALAEYQAAAQANGFEDVTLSAFQINTGDYTGQIMVVTQAPNSKRLGEFIDARSEDWSASFGNKFPKLRKLKRGFIMNCEVVYAK